MHDDVGGEPVAGTEPATSTARRMRGFVLPSLLVSAFAVMAVLLSLRGVEAGRSPGDTLTIYPWWAWVLAVGGVAAGAALLLPGNGRAARTVRGAAPCVAAVAAAQLAGTGVVGAKHWNPAMGMAGPLLANLEAVQRAGLALGAVGLVAALVATALLVRERGRRPRWLLVLAGVGLTLVLPFVISRGQADMLDVTSLGAMGLVYSGPWGAGLVAAGVVRDALVRPMLVVVAGSALLAAVGPQMDSLVTVGSRSVFATVVLVVVLAVVLVGPGDDQRERGWSA